jgi:ribosome maturation factor RimP
MMDGDSLKTRLTEMVEPLIKDNFMELVDLDVLAGGSMIRLLVDKIGGRINLDELADISRQVSAILDTAGLSENYSLEVGSPGINRPLKKKEDFTRFAGKKVRIVTKEKVNNERNFSGKLNGINGENVSLSMNENEVLLDFSNIRKANLDEDLF